MSKTPQLVAAEAGILLAGMQEHLSELNERGINSQDLEEGKGFVKEYLRDERLQEEAKGTLMLKKRKTSLQRSFTTGTGSM